MSTTTVLFLIFCLALAGFAYYLFRPVSNIPQPAAFDCISIQDGDFVSRGSLPVAQNIYGMGLTYSKHLLETVADFDPDALPPIFKKELQAIAADHARVQLPTARKMIEAVEGLEAEVGARLKKDFGDLSPMLDYEVELGFVLLESISASTLSKENFVPQLGFFLANDLSARSIAILGEGSEMRYAYWGLSKSFRGFLPISKKVWIPKTAKANSIPCIRLETYVNGEIRQSQTADNMIYTPLEMLRFIQKKYPNTSLQKGDLILTGTPGGVAIATPRALVRLGNLLGFDRFKKLSIKLKGEQSAFLEKGDTVEVHGEGFEALRTEIGREE